MSTAPEKTLQDTVYGLDSHVEWKSEYNKSCDDIKDGALPYTIEDQLRWLIMNRN